MTPEHEGDLLTDEGRAKVTRWLVPTLLALLFGTGMGSGGLALFNANAAPTNDTVVVALTKKVDSNTNKIHEIEATQMVAKVMLDNIEETCTEMKADIREQRALMQDIQTILIRMESNGSH